jgi:uncharacterized protein (TIGR03663 family)
MTRTAAAVTLLVVAVGALLLRLPQLDRRYVHTDEAVHAYKFNELLTTGRYVYDPHEYHGPTLYYATLPVAWVSGVHDWRASWPGMYRLVPVLFGVGLILLLPLLADGLGRTETIAAGVLTAVSPAMVFYSRCYVQETLLVFFTFLVVAAGWRYARSRRAGWLVLAGVGVGLMHATKETCIIAWGALAAALLLTWWLSRDAVRGMRLSPAHLAAALAAAGVVSVVLLSGFGTNLRGPLDAWLTFGTYLDRAGGGSHIHPWHFYLTSLLYVRHAPVPAWSEALVLGLAVVGMAVAFFMPKRTAHHPLWRFIALYTLLLAAFYAAIPYKTPWCMLGFLHGAVVLAGLGAATLLRAAGAGFGRLACVSALLIVGVAHLGVQAWCANTRFCNDVRNPHVYAHPVGDVLRLAGYVRQLAAAADREPVIHVGIPNCWPLPWYLRQRDRVGYWEGVAPCTGADVVIVSADFVPELPHGAQDTLLGPYYYVMRRDETVALFVHRELYADFERSLQRDRHE